MLLVIEHAVLATRGKTGLDMAFFAQRRRVVPLGVAGIIDLQTDADPRPAPHRPACRGYRLTIAYDGTDCCGGDGSCADAVPGADAVPRRCVGTGWEVGHGWVMGH